MVHPAWTPSAPPIAYGPAAYPPQHGAPPPPNVRTRPPAAAPMSPAAAPMPPAAHSGAVQAMPPAQAARVAAAHDGAPQAPGALGLVLFAAPLAFATMAVAALAFL